MTPLAELIVIISFSGGLGLGILIGWLTFDKKEAHLAPLAIPPQIL